MHKDFEELKKLSTDMALQYAPDHPNPTESGIKLRMAVRTGYEAGFLKAIDLAERVEKKATPTEIILDRIDLTIACLILERLRSEKDLWKAPAAGGQDKYAGLPPAIRLIDTALKKISKGRGIQFDEALPDK